MKDTCCDLSQMWKNGSCGQMLPGDIVFFISNSGETMEMRATVTAIKNNNCIVIGVSGNPDS